MFRSTGKRAIAQYNFGQSPLTQAFGSAIPPQPRPAAPQGFQSTTLSNGVKVVSHHLDGPHAAVGVYADVGPKYDPMSLPGISFVMRYAVQTSNMSDSLFQLDRTMRAAGNAYGHTEVEKRYIGWTSEGRCDAWEKPLEMLATSVAAPRFHESDIERFRDTMDAQLEEMRWQRPREYCIDELETVAFFKEPLGNPRMTPPLVNDRCGTTALLDHWAAHFQPNRITVAGVNVPHDALLAAYERVPYKHSGEAPHHKQMQLPPFSHQNEAAQFYPGRFRFHYEERAKAMGTIPDMEEQVIAAVGTLTEGTADVKKYATALVTSAVYDAAIARAAPATGRGARDGLRSFYRPYSTTGLMGYTLRCRRDEVAAALDLAASSYPTSVDDGLVAAGKEQTAILFLHSNCEMTRDYCDFIATSPHQLDGVLAAIRQVSSADVNGLLKAAGSLQPAVFGTGATFAFPKTVSMKK